VYAIGWLVLPFLPVDHKMSLPHSVFALAADADQRVLFVGFVAILFAAGFTMFGMVVAKVFGWDD